MRIRYLTVQLKIMWHLRTTQEFGLVSARKVKDCTGQMK